MNSVYLVLLAAAWVGIECLIGGTRLLYSLPAYGVISVAAVLTLASLRAKRVPPNLLCLGSTLLLGAWVLLRAAHSPVEYLAWPDFFMMLGCLMVYLLTAFYLTGSREQTVLIAVLGAIAGVEVWVGLIQFIKNPDFMLFGLLRHPGVRASGMYISPNNFAGYLVTVAVISLSCGIWSRWRVWAKILAFYTAFFCYVGVAISGSRGGYFAAIGSLLCFALASIYTTRVADPRRLAVVTIAWLGGVIAVVGFSAVLMYNSDFLARRMQTMVARDVRIYNWEAALDHFRVSPWVGTGSGTHLIYGRLFRRPEIQADPVHAHCDYLELLAEYGLAGAFCMALFLAAHLRNGLRTFSQILRRRLVPSGLHRSNSFAIQLGALCAVAGLAIHTVVDFDMHVPANALVFAFLFGALANPGLERSLYFSDRRVTPWLKILLPALGIFTIWRALPILPSEYYSEMARTSLRDKSYLTAIDFAKKGLGDFGPAYVPSEDEETREEPGILERWGRKIATVPKNPDLYFYIGEANRAMGSQMGLPSLRRQYFESAASAFESGLAIFPQDESMLVRYGQVLDGLNRFPEAENIYQRAFAADPHLGTLYEYYGLHLTAEGKKEEAKMMKRKQQEAMQGAVDADSEGRTSTSH